MRVKPFLISLILSLCFSNFIKAQNTILNEYKPLTNNNLAKEAAVNDINNNFKSIFTNLPTEYKEYYKDLYKNIQIERLKEINEDQYLFNGVFQKFFDNIIAEIKRGNPNLPLSEIKFLVSRDYSPNAVSTIDGNIIFNLSLLAQFDNESQVAFALCHEIAHNQLKHSLKSVKKYFDALYSKQGQQQIKDITNSKYNAYEKAEKYLKTTIFDHRRHSRDYEEQADSMALLYLSNTRFDANESVKALLKLDVIDSLMFSPNFNLTKVFDTPQYKFKKSWIEEEEGALFGGAKAMKNNDVDNDSLKTHPSCQKRAGLLQKMLYNKSIQGKEKNLQKPESFSEIATMAEFETLIAAYDNNKLDYCLFQTLKSIQKYPNNAFLHGLAGECLNALYDAQKNHTFSKSVSLPSRNLPANYQPYIRFLNNLSLREIALVNFHYLNQQDKSFLQKEFFLYNILLAAKNAEQVNEVKLLKTMYLANFPKGEYKENVLKL